MNNLEQLALSSHKKIATKWFEAVLASFPEDKNKFLETQDNIFKNPVGVNIKDSVKDVLKELLKEELDNENIKKLLDPVMRISAVQEFGPARATAFIFSLKEILRTEFKDKTESFYKDLDEISKKLDILALIGFENYMECREKIFELKARHVKERTLNILKAKDVFEEIEEPGTEIIPHEVFKKGGFDQQ